jgi:hypothetical protein
MKIKKTKTVHGIIAIWALTSLFAITRADITVNVDFENGDLSNWTQESGSTWEIVSFNDSKILRNATRPNNPSIIALAFNGQTDVTAFSLGFDYGWQYGDKNAQVMVAVALLDSSKNGYGFQIRQAGTGYSYELFAVTAGIPSSSVIKSAGTNNETAGTPLAHAALQWDGTTLKGIKGEETVVSFALEGSHAFSEIWLLDKGNLSNVKFDNIDLNVTGVSSIPELKTTNIAFGGTALLCLALCYRHQSRKKRT